MISLIKYSDIHQVFQNEQFKLMKKKGVYPYDHMNTFDKFNDKQSPTKDQFYHILNDDNQYKHAINV